MPNRRAVLRGLAAAGVVPFAAGLLRAAPRSRPDDVHAHRIHQSVCRWPYASVALPEFCRRVRDLGLVAVDLLHEDEWSVAQDAGLALSLVYPSRREGFNETGFNDPRNHPLLLRELETCIPAAARAGARNVIAMVGNRRPGIDSQAAIENCVTGLKSIAPLAAQHQVTVCLELLNSKIDHPGYDGDHLAFGLAVVDRVGSPRVKLLFDIYHLQIMEGDIIRNIREHIGAIGHFHTGGVPGRHEIDSTQELNYRAIAAAIADSGYQGYLAHEFVPTRRDPFESLAEAFRICDV